MDLFYLVYILSLSAGLFLLIRKGRFTPPFLWLGIYLLTIGFLQIAGRLSNMYFGSNMTLYLISVPFTYGLIFMVFQKMIIIERIKKLLWIFFCVFFLMMITQLVFVRINKLAEVLVTYNIAVVSFCLLYYYQMLQIPEEIKPVRQGVFWIVFGFFFYFLLSFVYWMVTSLFSRFVPGLRYFNVVLVIISYVIFWAGILVHLNERKVHGVR